MPKYETLDLQLFGEGGDGGSPTGEGEASNPGEDIPASIPEKAKGIYQKAMAKSKPQATTQPQEEVKEEPVHVSYSDLIKSDEYKEEHKAYMDKTISDRLKKYKGIEEANGKMSNALNTVAMKYGLDPTSETFLDDLTSKINADDSYIEDYAMDHNLSNEEARKSIEMQRKIEAYEAEKRQSEQMARQQQEINLLIASAERTKAVYPNFDLDTEMQNEQFRNLCAVTHGDTLAAYRTIHHDELMKAQGLASARIATQQIANSVASNKARPIENGLSSQASSISTVDYSKMNLQQIRAQADAWRREKR